MPATAACNDADIRPGRTSISLAQRVERIGLHAVRYGLVLVLLWIGGMKFTVYEAQGISAFIANSPAMRWSYWLLSEQAASSLIGAAEIAIALLIAARFASAQAAALGSALAFGMFLATLSFLLTTPGVWESTAGGFPALSVVPGQFLVKDVVLLAAALWTLGESWAAAHRDRVAVAVNP